MLAAFVDRARTIEELLIHRVIATCSTRLPDGGDDFVWSMAIKLPSLRAFLPVEKDARQSTEGYPMMVDLL